MYFCRAAERLRLEIMKYGCQWNSRDDRSRIDYGIGLLGRSPASAEQDAFFWGGGGDDLGVSIPKPVGTGTTDLQGLQLVHPLITDQVVE